MKKFTKASLMSLLMSSSCMVNTNAMDDMADLKNTARALEMTLQDYCKMMEIDLPKSEMLEKKEAQRIPSRAHDREDITEQRRREARELNVSIEDYYQIIGEPLPTEIFGQNESGEEEESFDDLTQEFKDGIVAKTLEVQENPESLATLKKFPSLLAEAKKMQAELEKYRYFTSSSSSSSSANSNFSREIRNDICASLCFVGNLYLKPTGDTPSLEEIAQQIISNQKRDDYTKDLITRYFSDVTGVPAVQMRQLWSRAWTLAGHLQMNDFIIDQIMKGSYTSAAERVNRGIIAYALLLEEAGVATQAICVLQEEEDAWNAEEAHRLSEEAANEAAALALQAQEEEDARHAAEEVHRLSEEATNQAAAHALQAQEEQEAQHAAEEALRLNELLLSEEAAHALQEEEMRNAEIVRVLQAQWGGYHDPIPAPAFSTPAVEAPQRIPAAHPAVGDRFKQQILAKKFEIRAETGGNLLPLEPFSGILEIANQISANPDTRAGNAYVPETINALLQIGRLFDLGEHYAQIKGGLTLPDIKNQIIKFINENGSFVDNYHYNDGNSITSAQVIEYLNSNFPNNVNTTPAETREVWSRAWTMAHDLYEQDRDRSAIQVIIDQISKSLREGSDIEGWRNLGFIAYAKLLEKAGVNANV